MRQTRSSHPQNARLNVRMTTNYPVDGVVKREMPHKTPANYKLGNNSHLIVFAGEDEDVLTASAVGSFLLNTAFRNSMSTVFGKPPFLSKFEDVVPSGCFIMGVAGDQIDDQGRQNLYKNFLQHDPLIHVFERLDTSDYFLCARHGFLLNQGIIATYKMHDRISMFGRLAKLALLSEKEMEITKWTSSQRARLIKVIMPETQEDISDQFYTWFEASEATKKGEIRDVQSHGLIADASTALN